MIDFSKIEKPLVMGILNITPDSFYEVSRKINESDIAERVEAMIAEGVDVIDVGAYSSRPDAVDVSANEEWLRLQKGLKIMRRVSPNITFSVDTFRADVVQRVFDKFGDFVVNDISAGDLDSAMFETVAKLKLPYIAMHMRGNPQTMQTQTDYDDMIVEIIEYFQQKIEHLRELGVREIILDPGFGFAKNIDQNYKLLADLSELNIFNLPLLVGFSRKSMLYKLLNITPAEALNATISANTIALMKGAKILRVHDVRAAVETVAIFEKMNEVK